MSQRSRVWIASVVALGSAIVVGVFFLNQGASSDNATQGHENTCDGAYEYVTEYQAALEEEFELVGTPTDAQGFEALFEVMEWNQQYFEENEPPELMQPYFDDATKLALLFTDLGEDERVDYDALQEQTEAIGREATALIEECGDDHPLVTEFLTEAMATPQG